MKRPDAALEPAPDGPVTVSSTEQDLGALVEHFKAKAEKSYADGVRDAAKVAESVALPIDGRYAKSQAGHMRDVIAAAIRALQDKPHD